MTSSGMAAGLKIITWTLERSGTLTDGGGFYFPDWGAIPAP